MKPANTAGFSLLEVLLVISVITALSALVIGATSGAHQAAARRRAEAEIAALETAIERYKDDNGSVPAFNATTGPPYEETNPDSQTYRDAARKLFNVLVPVDGKAYLPNRVNDPESDSEVVADPWGKPYGYNSSTNLLVNPRYPSVSIWSTGGEGSSGRTNRWITNWR
jgi:prepilin-type N-terminal cleavage/methylation domain-containing protein